MVVDDVPGFMRNIPDTESGQEAMSVLSDKQPTEVPPTAPTSETPPVTPTPPADPNAVVPPVAPVTPPVTETTPDKPKETPTTDTTPKPVDPNAPAAPVVTPVVEPAKPPVAPPVAPATPVVSPQEQARQAERKKLFDTIEVFKKQPVIPITVPKAENYKTSDGGFNMEAYMQDTMKSFALSIQQSVLGGPLASAMFGLINDAMSEVTAQQKEQERVDQETLATYNKLGEKFPRLKTDEKLQDHYERAIFGEAQRRYVKAKQEGKEPVKMVYEDFENILAELVGGLPSTPPPPADVTVSPPGGPMLGADTTPMSETEKDIAGMMAAKNKQLF